MNVSCCTIHRFLVREASLNSLQLNAPTAWLLKRPCANEMRHCTVTQGASYNIPVAIVVPADYPIMAPVCYVEPTPTMELNRSAHAYRLHPEPGGTRGRVETSTAWLPEHSSLIDVIIDMCQLFSASPPVKARSRGSPPRPAASPYPAVDAPGASARPGQASTTHGNPAYPAYHPPAAASSSEAANQSSHNHISYPPISPNLYPGASSSQYPGSAASASSGYPPASSAGSAAYPPGGGFAWPPQPPAQPPYAGAGSASTSASAASRPAKDAHEVPFKQRAVDSLTDWVVESLQLSCQELSEEVTRLESTAQRLAENRQVWALRKVCDANSSEQWTWLHFVHDVRTSCDDQ
jgi:UEV domain